MMMTNEQLKLLSKMKKLISQGRKKFASRKTVIISKNY